MSYSPIGAPDEVLPLALELAAKANAIRAEFETRIDADEDFGLGEQVEMLRPLWEIVGQLGEILAPARDRSEWWEQGA